MKILTLIFLIYSFFKTWYYGLYELKTNKNKTAAISMFFMAIVRSYISNYFNYLLVFIGSFSFKLFTLSFPQVLFLRIINTKIIIKIANIPSPIKTPPHFPKEFDKSLNIPSYQI